jgi:hypothetical protein
MRRNRKATPNKEDGKVEVPGATCAGRQVPGERRPGWPIQLGGQHGLLVGAIQAGCQERLFGGAAGLLWLEVAGVDMESPEFAAESDA